MEFKKVSEAPEQAAKAPYISCARVEEIDLEKVGKTRLATGPCDGECGHEIVWSADTMPKGPKKLCTACTIREMIKGAREKNKEEKLVPDDVAEEVYSALEEIAAKYDREIDEGKKDWSLS